MQASDDDSKSEALSAGWALKVSKQTKRFDHNQFGYVKSKFDEGGTTGIKWLPENLSKQMRKENIGGRPRFLPAQYLTEQQIASLFSRLAAMQRKGKDTGRATTPEEVSAIEEEEQTNNEYLDDVNYESNEDQLRQGLRERNILK